MSAEAKTPKETKVSKTWYEQLLQDLVRATRSIVALREREHNARNIEAHAIAQRCV